MKYMTVLELLQQAADDNERGQKDMVEVKLDRVVRELKQGRQINELIEV